MKRVIGIACVFFVLALWATVCACTDDVNEATYRVSVIENAEFRECYTVTLSADECKEGDTVTVKAEDSYGFLDFAAVYANGTACAETSQGDFTFVMPAADVSVEISFNIAQVTEDNGMSWTSTPEITRASGVVKEFTVDFGGTFVSNSTYANSVGESGMTFIRLLSTDHGVFPPEAVYRIMPIETGAPYANASGAKIIVNCGNVSAGTSTLIFIDKQNMRAITYELTVA